MAKLFKGIGHLLFGSPVQPPVPPPVVTRDDAAAFARRDDELRRRQGSAADILTGAGGVEPGAGAIGRLIVGN